MTTRGDGRGLEHAEHALSSANRLTDQLQGLLEQVREASREGLISVAGLAAFVIALFWAGHVLAHRLERAEGRDRGSRRRGTMPAPPGA